MVVQRFVAPSSILDERMSQVRITFIKLTKAAIRIPSLLRPVPVPSRVR